MPSWMTQITSLSKDQILKTGTNAFKRFGLDILEYIVETNVTTLSFTELMGQLQSNDQPPFLVLVDTEGFDCNVIEGISASSPYLPKFLVFEHIHCNSTAAVKWLHGMGYHTQRMHENTIALHRDLEKLWPLPR